MNSNSPLGLGKVNRDVLNEIVFPHFQLFRRPTLDANVIRGNLAVSHNLAIGTPVETLGFFAFHYATSNVTMRFAKPGFITTGIYLPLKSTKKELEVIAAGLGEEERKYRVKVIAGHTGVYKGLSSPLVSVTCFGRVVRKPGKPSFKDLILIAGNIGEEAVWLKTLEKGGTEAGSAEPSWRLTPLPLGKALLNVKDVKLMHDVSEGGVAGALYEVAENVPYRLSVSSSSMPYHDRVKDSDEDPLRVPSYGALIIVAREKGLNKILNAAKKLHYPCAVVGSLERGRGLFIDGTRIEGITRTRMDEIYGSF